jgi:hypothetical protein
LRTWSTRFKSTLVPRDSVGRSMEYVL